MLGWIGLPTAQSSRRTDHNGCPVSMSLAQTHLYQSYTRHSVLTEHLPHIPNASTMCEALGQALPGKAFDSGQ